MLKNKKNTDVRQVVREEIQESVKHLPTKDELYTKMDDVMCQLKALLEEQTLIKGLFSQHSDDLEEHDLRISKLEEHARVTSPVG